MEPQNVRKSGVVLRKVQRNDKWVRRWLQTHGHVLCSYNADPNGEVQAKVLNALDLRKIRDIVLLETDARGTAFVVIPKTDDGSKSHPGYIMRAESPADAQDWVEVLNHIRTLKDDTEEDRDSVRKPEETFCFCFKREKQNFDASSVGAVAPPL